MRYLLNTLNLQDLQKMDILLTHGLMTKEEAQEALKDSEDKDGDGISDSANVYKPNFPG